MSSVELPLTKEQQLCAGAGLLLAIACVWLAFARRRARVTAKGAYRVVASSPLREPLIEDDDDETAGPYVLKSRTRLAARQALVYAMALFYLLGAAVYAVRLIKGKGPTEENEARTWRCAADVLRAIAWVVAARAAAAEYVRPRGDVSDESRGRLGRDVDISLIHRGGLYLNSPRRRVAATPRSLLE